MIRISNTLNWQRTRPHRFRHGPRPLQHPVFRRVVAASAIAYLTRFIDFTVAAWLVVERSDSPSAVGLLVFFRIIPFLILGPFIGTLVDRYPRIRTYRSSQLGLAVAAAAFAMITASGYLTLPAIYVYSIIVGSLMATEIASRRAYMSSIVGPAALGSALALEMVSLNIAWFVGSNLGGVVVKLVDPSSIYFAIGIVFAVNFVALRRLPRMFRLDPKLQTVNPIAALADGYRLVRANRTIMIGLLIVGINNFFGYGFESMAPVFARDKFGAGPTGFGLLMSAQALGALIVASYIATRRRRFRNPGLLLISTAMVQAIGTIGFSYVETIGIGFAALAGLGLVSMMFGIAHTVLILTATPNEFRGRILGFQVLMMGLFPIGSLLLGFTANSIGLGQAVRIFALVGLGLLMVIWARFPLLRKPISIGPETQVGGIRTSRQIDPT